MDNKIYNFINESYFKQKRLPVFEHFIKPELISVDTGRVEVKMTVREEHLNLHRITHGGVLFALADLTMGLACISHYKSIVTTDMNIQYIKNVNAGKTIKAIGIVENNGNSLMRTSCNIYDEDGRLLIRSSGSYFVLGELDMDAFNTK